MKDKTIDKEMAYFPNSLPMEKANFVHIAGMVGNFITNDNFMIINAILNYTESGRAFSVSVPVWIFDEANISYLENRIKNEDLIDITGHLQSRQIGKRIELSVIADEIKLFSHGK